MKKLFTLLAGLAMGLVFGSMAMAQNNGNCPSRTQMNMVTMYDARAYHESFPGAGSTVGGWQFNIDFVKELPWGCINPDTGEDVGPAELLKWTDEVTSKEIELRNNLSGNSYFMKPTYCYNTSTKFPGDSYSVPVYACDAVVWFGNKLNVTDGATTNNNMATMEVYIDGILENQLPAADDSRINLFPYPEILGGKNAMSYVGNEIQIYYTTAEVANTTLSLNVFDSTGNVVWKNDAPMIQGGKKFVLVPAIFSKYTARFQMQTNDSPRIRKATVFQLP